MKSLPVDFEYDAYISYSSHDIGFAQLLAEHLTKAGLRIWFDKWSIQPGDRSDYAIQKGLEQSRTVVFLMSKHSLNSEWVTLESGTAIFRDPLNKSRRFLPLRLDDTPIPDMLGPYNYVDCRGPWSGHLPLVLAALRSKYPDHMPQVPTSTQRGHLPFLPFAIISPLLAAGVSLRAPAIAPLVALVGPVLAILLRRRLFPAYAKISTARVALLSATYLTTLLYLMPSLSFPEACLGSGAVSAALLLAYAALARFTLLPARDVLTTTRTSRRAVPLGLSHYCSALSADLDRYDREVNWSDQELTALEAEIEVHDQQSSHPRRARDLVEAIRRDRDSPVFVVLGEPGSGKSVSLRRLVRLLCKEASTTGIVPIYANLREYPEHGTPTPEALVRFLHESAERQTGRDGRAFLDTYYELFRHTGRLFLVLDSFDEIPAVLDADDASDRHRTISTAFDRLFTQEFQTCRAVLASRFYRAPTSIRATRLSIQPFREHQIRAAMRKWLEGHGIDTDAYIRRLFIECPQLVPLLRNPFTAELIADFARTKPGQLPTSYYEVVDSYIAQRLGRDEPALKSRGTSVEAVRRAAGMIAATMYTQAEIGLEARIDTLHAALDETIGRTLSPALDGLRYSRLIRIGGHDLPRVSFVHRRFAEYFVVSTLDEESLDAIMDGIPTDSRWRDCLVMYCGIASPEAQRKVAEYCWSIIRHHRKAIQKGALLAARPLVHSLRFLAEAFRSSPSATSGFRPRLSRLTVSLLAHADLLVAKIAAEAIPLLAPREQSRGFHLALSRGSPWVAETALAGCRHLGELHPVATSTVRRYVRSLGSRDFIERFRDLTFSLSLSDVFRSQRRRLFWDAAEYLFITCLVIGISVVFLAWYPLISIMAMLGCSFLMIFNLSVQYAVLPSVASILDEDPFETALPQGFRDFLIALEGLLIGPLRFWFRLLPATLFFCIPLYSSLERWLIDYHFWLSEGQINACAAALFVMTLPWEMLVLAAGALRTGVRNANKLWGFAKVIAVPSLVALLCGAICWLVVERLGSWIFGALKPTLDWIFETADRLHLIWIAGALLAVFLLKLAYETIRVLGAMLVWQLTSAREKAHLQRIGWPAIVQSADVYATCLRFTTKEARLLYLRTLRLRRIPHQGDVAEAPPVLLYEPALAEEIARLRQQWYGLEN